MCNLTSLTGSQNSLYTQREDLLDHYVGLKLPFHLIIYSLSEDLSPGDPQLFPIATEAP